MAVRSGVMDLQDLQSRIPKPLAVIIIVLPTRFFHENWAGLAKRAVPKPLQDFIGVAIRIDDLVADLE